MACPKEPCFKVLHQLMQYLYHHPHYPLFFPRTTIERPIQLSASTKHGHAEYITSPNKQMTLKAFADADQGRDVSDRRAISSAIWTINQVLVHWLCKKQAMVGLSSNHTEMITLLQCVKTTTIVRRKLYQLGYPQIGPTTIHEDNQPLIDEVLNHKITSNVRHLDVPLTFLQEQFRRYIFKPIYTHTTLQEADFNTKPHGGQSLKTAVLKLIGFKYFPPANSEHFKLLQLNVYNISRHIISQRRQTLTKQE